MRKATDYERNTYNGHALYQKLIGEGQCQCEVCLRLRYEIDMGEKYL